MSPPVRIVVVRGVVGDWELASPIGADRIDLRVGCGSGVVDIGYPLTGRRVVRVIVGRGVVGELALAPPPALIVKISESSPSEAA